MEALAQEVQSEFKSAETFHCFSCRPTECTERLLELFSYSLVRALKKPREYQLLRIDLLVSRLYESLDEATLVKKTADPEIESIVENELVLEDEGLLLEDLLDDFEDFCLESWIVD